MRATPHALPNPTLCPPQPDPLPSPPRPHARPTPCSLTRRSFWLHTQGQDDKIRVVLNKADAVNPQQLMRVYGAMMWSLGKVIKTPEVVRVYVGSFWDEPYKNKDNEKLFQAEQADLVRDLRNLPANSTVRKVNEIVKRARLLRVHAHIIGYLKQQMPSMFGKSSKQDELINGMRDVFQAVQRQYNLPMVRRARGDGGRGWVGRAGMGWVGRHPRRQAQVISCFLLSHSTSSPSPSPCPRRGGAAHSTRACPPNVLASLAPLAPSLPPTHPAFLAVCFRAIRATSRTCSGSRRTARASTLASTLSSSTPR